MANTQSREVNLTKRVQTSKGMRYCTVVLGSNGRLRPDVVLVNGRPERHSEGSYYLEWREKGRRIRLSVGKDAQDAAARRQRKEAELRALNNGVPILQERRSSYLLAKNGNLAPPQSQSATSASHLANSFIYRATKIRCKLPGESVLERGRLYPGLSRSSPRHYFSLP